MFNLLAKADFEKLARERCPALADQFLTGTAFFADAQTLISVSDRPEIRQLWVNGWHGRNTLPAWRKLKIWAIEAERASVGFKMSRENPIRKPWVRYCGAVEVSETPGGIEYIVPCSRVQR